MSENTCYHCGDEIIGKSYSYDQKSFCCNGCRSVYLLLKSNDLDSFYSIEEKAGTRPNSSYENKYAFLDIERIRSKHIDFEDEKSVHVTLFLPSIHCSSCIFLLENITRLDPRILSCQVNFTKREAAIIFSNQMPFSELAKLLEKIGYAPNFGNRKEQLKKQNYTYLYKLGVAGFAFGSIMLWSFPEYLGIENDHPEFRVFTSYLSFAVSIPVLLYSANEYLISAYKALKHRSLNLDVPISIGIIALYGQSCFTIFSGMGPGYMDSFAGFIFFLLIGKWFQSKTYQSLSFERDYTAYFPVAVTRIQNESDEIIEIDQLQIGDEIEIRNMEILPCDAILLDEEVKIDYAFVTGEAIPVTKKQGEFIYAGGKLLGQKSRFKVQKESSRSHLTQLWNESSKEKRNREVHSDKLSVYFLAGVLIISFIAGIVWAFFDPSRITEIVVAILIVACPCALALSKPFTYGNVMRIVGRKGLYLKNTSVIPIMNEVTDIVFDKTGTLTTGSANLVAYSGSPLQDWELQAVLVLANSSTHPLSRALVQEIKTKASAANLTLTEFQEQSGKGIEGVVNGKRIQVGSIAFVGGGSPANENQETTSHLSINGEYKGCFTFQSDFREGMQSTLNDLQSNYTLHIVSGDNERDKAKLTAILGSDKNLIFKQSPKDKLKYIQNLKNHGKNVMMVGDGLNDSGALDLADVGIAVSEDIFRFTPNSDAIIEASKLSSLPQFLRHSLHAKTVLRICYVFSILYNFVGLSFAISGKLTPLIAAILMPLSSISIVVISTLFTNSKR